MQKASILFYAMILSISFLSVSCDKEDCYLFTLSTVRLTNQYGSPVGATTTSTTTQCGITEDEADIIKESLVDTVIIGNSYYATSVTYTTK